VASSDVLSAAKGLLVSQPEGLLQRLLGQVMDLMGVQQLEGLPAAVNRVSIQPHTWQPCRQLGGGGTRVHCCLDCFVKLAKKHLHGWRPLRFSSAISLPLLCASLRIHGSQRLLDQVM
jgi:hypothetical protein